MVGGCCGRADGKIAGVDWRKGVIAAGVAPKIPRRYSIAGLRDPVGK